MSSSFPSSLDVELETGRPPMLRVAEVRDAQSWAAEHRDALRAAVTERVAGFAAPTRIAWFDGPLPRTATGKVLKRELRVRHP